MGTDGRHPRRCRKPGASLRKSGRVLGPRLAGAILQNAVPVPAKILLATDLTAKSDRATERALFLMTQWNADLVAVHGVAPSNLPTADVERAARARGELRDQLRAVRERASIRVEHTDAADLLRRTAADEGCSTIVMGIARRETLGGVELGDTIDNLLRDLAVPMLAVVKRARAPYARICVAVDFSDASRNALVTTCSLFPGQPLTLLHAYDAPGDLRAPDPEAYRQSFRPVACKQVDEFLAGVAFPAGARPLLGIQVEPGEPARQIERWVRALDADLVVVGTRGRGRIAELFLGSVARRVLELAPCDVLVIPPSVRFDIS